MSILIQYEYSKYKRKTDPIDEVLRSIEFKNDNSREVIVSNEGISYQDIRYSIRNIYERMGCDITTFRDLPSDYDMLPLNEQLCIYQRRVNFGGKNEKDNTN